MNALMMYENLALFLCTSVGIIYAVIKFSKKEMPVYCLSILCAWIDIALGRLYMFLILLVDKADLNDFNLSWLAMIGSFIFLFSANYGYIDKSTAEIAKGTKKEVLTALVAPLCVVALYAVNTFAFKRYGTFLTLPYRIFSSVLTLLIIQTTFYSLKHLIVKTDKSSTLYKMRGFNFVILVYSFLIMIEVTAPISQSVVLTVIVYALTAITTLAAMPVLKRGNVQR